MSPRARSDVGGSKARPPLQPDLRRLGLWLDWRDTLGRHVQPYFIDHPPPTQPQQGGVQFGIFHLGLISSNRMSKDNTAVLRLRLTCDSPEP